LFVNIVMYAYFIDISQGSVKTHLQCGVICNNHLIANCPQSVLVKEIMKKKLIIGEEMDKSKVPRFLAHPVHIAHIMSIHQRALVCCRF